MILTNSQQNIVDKLFKKYSDKDEGVFLKAPTGSGKTFIASSLISKVFAESVKKDEKIMVVVATISNADLPSAFAKKLNDYKKYHDKFNSYNVEHITSPSKAKNSKHKGDLDIRIEDKKVIVFGTSSFTKSSLFTQNNVLEVFVQEVALQGYKLFYIRDEAHVGSTKKAESKRIDDVMRKHAYFTMEMTATPNTTFGLVELTEDELKNDIGYLLKENLQKHEINEDMSNDEIIDTAIKNFITSRKDYEHLDAGSEIINPAMLVQVINEPNANRDPEGNRLFNEGLMKLENKLKNAGLKYLKYLDNKEVVGTSAPATLDYASKNDSTIDVILFKIGPATGWDIPRANTLLQLRNVSSPTLNAQTVGRIKRNPYPNLELNELTNKYWIYSNYQEGTRGTATYNLKTKFRNGNLELYNGRIDVKSDIYKADISKFRKKLSTWIEKDFKDYVHNQTSSSKWFDNITYDDNNMSLGAKQIIPNIVSLLLENYPKWNEVEDKFVFEEHLKPLKKIKSSSGEILHIELIKYFFLLRLTEVKKIYSDTIKWNDNEKMYVVKSTSDISKQYNLWIGNDNPKKVDVSELKNYGYKLISTKEMNIQYLDSTPEEHFFKKVLMDIVGHKLVDAEFIAKMPTLGSKIYFEYWDQDKHKISRSYIDFAIKIKGKIIMFEIKGLDEADYDSNKTTSLTKGYEKYMMNKGEKEIELVIYQYNKTTEKQSISHLSDGKWKTSKRPGEILEKIFI